MESDRRLEYNFYYYTSDGVFMLNSTTFLMYGLVLSSILLIFSAEGFYEKQEYIKLIITTILFVGMLLTIRWLNNKG